MAVTAAGGIFLWHDGRNNPDTAQCLLEYPGGYLVSYHMRLGNGADTRELMFYGTQGTLDLNAGVAYGDKAGGEVILRNPGSYYPEYVVDAAQRLPDRDQGGLVLKVGPSKDHVSDFFSAVRARKQPCADIDSAFTHALATIMAGLSLHNGVRVEYDADKDVLYPKELMEDLNYPTSAAAETRSS